MNGLNRSVINERSVYHRENPADAAVHKNRRDLFISTHMKRRCCDATEIIRRRCAGQGWEGNARDIERF
jgi:hypothetical protein